MFALARKKFSEGLMYEIDELETQRNLSPYSLRCLAYDTDKDEVVSYFSWSITDTRFRDDLVNGKVKEEERPLYDGSNPPVLFFDTFVVTNALHSPYIIRHLINDLQAIIKADELDIVGGLSIGGLRFTEKWLKKYNFHEIGKYQGQYPILWASREDSVILNTLCSPKKKFTIKPWKSE